MTPPRQLPALSPKDLQQQPRQQRQPPRRRVTLAQLKQQMESGHGHPSITRSCPDWSSSRLEKRRPQMNASQEHAISMRPHHQHATQLDALSSDPPVVSQARPTSGDRSPGQRALRQAKAAWLRTNRQRRTVSPMHSRAQTAGEPSSSTGVPMASRAHAVSAFESALGHRLAALESELATSVKSTTTKWLKQMESLMRGMYRRESCDSGIKSASFAVLAVAREIAEKLILGGHATVSHSTKELSREILTANESQVAQVWEQQRRLVARTKVYSHPSLCTVVRLHTTPCVYTT
jgi:hypothetical protein